MSYTLFQICSVSNLVFVPKDQYLGISCDPTLMVFQILLKLISKKMLDPFFSLGKSFDYLGSCAYFVCRPENLEEQITLCCCITYLKILIHNKILWERLQFRNKSTICFSMKNWGEFKNWYCQCECIPVIISQILWGKKMVVK